MGSKAEKSTGRRRGRKLLVLGLIGLGVAVYKATREAAAPAPAPAREQAPAPVPASTVTPEPASAVEPEAIERLETEAPVVPGVEPEAVVPEPLAEPVFEAAPVEEPAAAAPEPAAPEPATAELHDIVEEPWAADAEVTPATEPPADSLTSFFDEVMTDTAERKLRKGR